MALLLTLTLGLVDPAGVRAAPVRDSSGSLWGVALSRAVEALVEAGECPPNAALPIAEAESISMPSVQRVLVADSSTAKRGEGDLPPPPSA